MSADRGGWQLDSDPTGIWLTIPRAELEQLGQTESFAERLMREFPVAAGQQVKVILEALLEAQAEERSVLEITLPQPNNSELSPAPTERAPDSEPAAGQERK